MIYLVKRTKSRDFAVSIFPHPDQGPPSPGGRQPCVRAGSVCDSHTGTDAHSR